MQNDVYVDVFLWKKTFFGNGRITALFKTLLFLFVKVNFVWKNIYR